MVTRGDERTGDPPENETARFGRRRRRVSHWVPARTVARRHVVSAEWRQQRRRHPRGRKTG